MKGKDLVYVGFALIGLAAHWEGSRFGAAMVMAGGIMLIVSALTSDEP